MSIDQLADPETPILSILENPGIIYSGFSCIQCGECSNSGVNPINLDSTHAYVYDVYADLPLEHKEYVH